MIAAMRGGRPRRVMTIRLIAAGRCRLVQDIACGLARAPDMKVVGAVVEPLTVMLAVRKLRARAVILDADDPALAGLSSHLLGEYPGLTIIGVSGGEVYVEQLCPRRRTLPQRSEQAMLAGLRDSLRNPCY